MAARLPRISSYLAILANVRLCSFCNASISKPISLYRRISKMAVACRSVKQRCLASSSEPRKRNFIFSVLPCIRHSLASRIFFAPRKISIIKSMTSQALIRPSCTSFFSSSLASNVLYLRVASSYWKSTWWRIMGTSPIVSGLPSATASILTPNVSSRRVFL